MGMADLMIRRKLLYNQDLMLTDKVLISLVMDAGDDGFYYNLRYLTRAMNCSAAKVTVVINHMVKHGFITDTQAEAAVGVMVPRVLKVGPESRRILEDRTVNSGGTTHDYIPTSSFENLIQDIDKEEITP